MKTELSGVVIALAVVIALVGAVGVVSADMNTNASNAPMHGGDETVGHVADGTIGIGEMTHTGEHMHGSMVEHVNDHEPGNHHGSGHGHC